MAEPKKLFKFALEEGRVAESSKRQFLARVNRWRFDPFDYPRVWKSNNRGGSSISSSDMPLDCSLCTDSVCTVRD